MFTEIERMLRRGLYSLFALGLLSVGVYIVAFTRRYPLIAIAHRGGVPDIGVLSGYRWSASIAYVAAIMAAFVLYGLALRLARRMGADRGAAWGVVILGLAAAVALIATYPFAASDVFLYVARGRVLGVHGYNPFVVPPGAFPMDTYVPFRNQWMTVVSPYGPLWEWLAAPLALLGDGSLVRSLLAFKGAALATYLGCTAVVAAILRRRDPGRLVWGLVAFAWNPLVLIETHANAHNDLAMVFFVLLAVWLWESRRYAWVIPALVLGGLIKVVPLMLVPVTALLLGNRLSRREWLRTLLAAGLISLGLVLMVFGPLWPGLRNWGVLSQMNLAFYSTGTWLTLVLRKVAPSPMAFRAAGWTTRVLFASAYAVMMVWALIRPRSLAAAFHDILYLWLAVGSMAFGYWYITWLVPLATLIPGRVDMRRAAAFSATGMLSVAVYTYLGIKLRESVGTDMITLIAIPFVFGIPLIVGTSQRREQSDVDRRHYRAHAMGWFGPCPAPLTHPGVTPTNDPVAGVPAYPFDYDLTTAQPMVEAGARSPATSGSDAEEE